VAAADVDVHRLPPIKALLDEPVGLGGPDLFAVPALGIPLLGCRDLLPDPVEGVGEPGLQGAESGQVGRQIVHASSLHHNSNARSNRVMARHRVDYLTDTQERILRYIREAITDRGEAPTVQEIGERVGMRSRASVHYQLGELESKNAIVREPGRRRGIRLA
jgi:repressor LexA